MLILWHQLIKTVNMQLILIVLYGEQHVTLNIYSLILAPIPLKQECYKVQSVSDVLLIVHSHGTL
jgi:hypothetical protein